MLDSRIIHRSVAGGAQIRFVGSPLFARTGHPDHPWHVHDDLLKVMGLAEADRVEMIRRRASDGEDETDVLGTSEGILRIASHLEAQKLFATMGERRLAGPSARVASSLYFSGIREATATMLGTSDEKRLLVFTIKALDGSGKAVW